MIFWTLKILVKMIFFCIKNGMKCVVFFLDFAFFWWFLDLVWWFFGLRKMLLKFDLFCIRNGKKCVWSFGHLNFFFFFLVWNVFWALDYKLSFFGLWLFLVIFGLSLVIFWTSKNVGEIWPFLYQKWYKMCFELWTLKLFLFFFCDLWT